MFSSPLGGLAPAEKRQETNSSHRTAAAAAVQLLRSREFTKVGETDYEKPQHSEGRHGLYMGPGLAFGQDKQSYMAV